MQAHLQVLKKKNQTKKEKYPLVSKYASLEKVPFS